MSVDNERPGLQGILLTRQLLVGAATGTWLLVADLFFVNSMDFSLMSWISLGAGPMLVWILGFVGGGFALPAMVLLARPIQKLTGKVPDGERRDSLGSLASSIATIMILVGLAGIAVLQVNRLWLPYSFGPLSLVVTALILGGIGFIAWLLGGRLRRLLERFFWHPSWALVAVAGSFVLASLPLLVAALEPSPRVTGWRAEDIQVPLTPQTEANAGKLKLLLLGFDGARWETIDPMLEAGALPHLSSLIARGQRGVLRCEGESASPIAWTTIMTGRPPVEHGITGWDVSVSTNRRVSSIWNILDSLGWKTMVLNVPASYPADRLRNGAFLAGFPIPQTLGNSLGWLLYNGGVVDPHGPIPTVLRQDPVDGDWVVTTMHDQSQASVVLSHSTPYRFLDRLDSDLGDWLHRRLMSVPLVGKSWGLEVSQEQTGGIRRIKGRDASTREPLFALEPGEWSSWLSVEIGLDQYAVRARAIEERPGDVRLFFTPLYREGIPGLSSPPTLATALGTVGAPYLVEATGWAIFSESSTLGALEENIRQIAEAQAEAALSLMASSSWEVFIHVVTVTDRVQHGFWKFHEPDTTGQLYPALKPEPEQVERYGGAIRRSYELADSYLGRLLDHTDESTLVVVVSDHGAQAGHHPMYPTAGDHHPDGIYAIAGPTVAVAQGVELGPRLIQEDLVPLILAHLGVPAGEDMAGVIPRSLLPRAADGTILLLPTPVSSYEADGAPRGLQEIDQATIEQLRSLGYIQ